MFKYSQYIIALNRLIIIPIIFIAICAKVIINYNIIPVNDNYIKYILVAIFCIATFLRLVVGLTNEVMASWKAINYIKTKDDEDMLVLGKKIYSNSLCNQIFMFIIFAIFGVIACINL